MWPKLGLSNFFAREYVIVNDDIFRRTSSDIFDETINIWIMTDKQKVFDTSLNDYWKGNNLWYHEMTCIN